MEFFWVFQGYKYVRVLNFPGYAGFTYFPKYDNVLNVSDAIMKGFLTFQDSKYAKFLYMQGLNKVLNIFEYRRIIVLLSCHKRGWSESTFFSCLNVKELLRQNGCNVSATVNWLQPVLNPQPLTLQMNSKTFS